GDGPRAPTVPARAPRARELRREAREEQHELLVDELELRDLEVPEALTRGAERWLRLPPHQVVRARMADEAALVARAGGGPSGHEHVPAVAVRVGEDVGIAPRLVGPERVGELLVPAGVGLEDGRRGVPAPAVQVGRRGQPDTLLEAVLGGGRAGV